MKKLTILLAVVFGCMVTQSTQAQSDKYQRTIGTKSQTIRVNGECSMSKKRIERAAQKVEGIKSVNWNDNTKMLTITYDLFKKDAVSNVQKSLAASGFDTNEYKASDAAYLALPVCCRYQREM